MTRKLIGFVLFFALLAPTGLVGCGKVSNFTVDVIVDGPEGKAPNKLTQVHSVEVQASGAVSDEPTFGFSPSINQADIDSMGRYMIGRFEYGTTSDSGKVNFAVTLLDGSRNSLGEGSGEGTIQSGGNVALSIVVTPKNFL